MQKAKRVLSQWTYDVEFQFPAVLRSSVYENGEHFPFILSVDAGEPTGVISTALNFWTLPMRRMEYSNLIG